MSEVAESLREAVRELFERELDGASREVFASRLWERLESIDLPRVGIPEAAGGAGGGLAEAVAVARVAGYCAAPVPLADTAMLAAWVAAEAGFTQERGPQALVTGDLDLARDSAGWRLSGRAQRVPWARTAARMVVLAGGLIAVVPPGQAKLKEGANLGGEARDEVVFSEVKLGAAAVRAAPAGLDENAIRARGALCRAALMVGGLERILELTVNYALQREQFGRPLARFQSLQHGAAIAAAEVAEAIAALDMAVERDDQTSAAIAKICASAAVGTVTQFAHQVHGAIGFTREHPLHLYTTRLWAWRDEYGSEEEWSMRVGREAVRRREELWKFLA